MKHRELLIFFVVFLLITLVFFYKTILFGLIPFPGDLLVAEYSPWKTYSYLGYNPGSYPNKAQYFDTIRQIYPWKTLTVSMIKNGEIPLWNPYNFSGSPLLANYQSAVFYPFSAFYMFFSQIVAWTLLIFLQPFLAGIGTFLYARKLGLNAFSSFLSAFAFSFSLFMIVFLEYNTINHAILWLPFALFATENLLEKVRYTSVIMLIGSLVFSFLAGHLQLSALVFSFVVIYALLGILKRKQGKKILYAGFLFFLFLLVIGICAIQFLPTLELLNNAARVSQEYDFLINILLIQPYQLIMFFIPDFFGNPATRNYLLNDPYPGKALYIGVIPFLFGLFTLVHNKNNYHKRFFTITIALLLLFLVRSPFTELLYRLQIPFISTSSPTNSIFLISFSLAILAGFGYEYWQKENKKIHGRYLLLSVSVFSVLLILGLLLSSKTPSVKNILFSSSLLIAFLSMFFLSTYFIRLKKVILYLFICVTVLDLFYFFHKFNPFIPKELVFPTAKVIDELDNNRGRFWGYKAAGIEPNYATQYSLFAVDGYDPLYSRRYGAFIQSAEKGKLITNFTNRTRSDAIITSEGELSENLYRLRIIDVLGVNSILDRAENGSTEKTFNPSRFSQQYNQNGWRIYENKNALPRVFFAEGYQVFRTDKEFEEKFFAENFTSKRIILLEKEIGELGTANKDDKVTIISYRPNSVHLKTTNQKKRLLFLSDAYYPGWQAMVDNKQVEVLRANYTFRAIVVPDGEHEIIFTYNPQSFQWGARITIISCIALLFFGLILKKSEIYEK